MGVYFVSLKFRQGNTQNIKIIKTDPVGLAENSTPASIRLFPNPFTGFIQIESPTASQIHIQMYNSVGQVLYSRTHEGFNPRIDLSYLQGGLYYLDILCRDEHTVFRVIKD
jgi:hypothetical protein